MKKILALAAGLLLAASLAHAQTAGTVTNNLSVNPVAEAAMTITSSAPTTLSEGGTPFSNYTGTTSFTYYIRTSMGSSGSGKITLQVTTDFLPTGGPSAYSPATGDALTYMCAAASPATPCSGSLTANATASTVADFGADAHSAKAGTAGNSVAWTLPNDPAYQTGGPYVAVVTYTISAS